MRKIIAALTLLSLVLPVVAFAQIKDYCTMSADVKYGDVTYKSGIKVYNPDAAGAPGACPTSGTANADCSTVEWGTVCILNTISRIFTWIWAILIAIVGIMIVIGAFNIITAGGSPEKVTAGRNYILYALIGMVVAFFAKAIPAIVSALIR
jgi:uncharacterized membrane protein